MSQSCFWLFRKRSGALIDTLGKARLTLSFTEPEIFTNALQAFIRLPWEYLPFTGSREYHEPPDRRSKFERSDYL
ncbi:hypothetical protein [Microcoleus sp. FACHB-68]|uniref:hypothetical protein n=1 Tax=Microcoleus sp. FACHB-68 TaxID=2692826 RepID=UPI00321FF153